MIIAARSFPDTPRTLDEADMFTLLLERQHDLIPRVSSAAANQRGEGHGGRGAGAVGGGERKKRKGNSGAWSGALANQTRAAESINITISKIRAGVLRFSSTPPHKHARAQARLSLTNYAAE